MWRCRATAILRISRRGSAANICYEWPVSVRLPDISVRRIAASATKPRREGLENTGGIGLFQAQCDFVITGARIRISDNQFHSLSVLLGYMSGIRLNGGGRRRLGGFARPAGAGAKLVGMFEVILTRRKRFGWRWQVCDQSGKIFADGFERTRPSAKYHGERALFFLLSQAHLRNRSAAASED